MSYSSQRASSTVPAQDPSLTDEHMAESGGGAAQFSGPAAAQSSVPSTIVVDSSIEPTVQLGQSQDPSYTRGPEQEVQSSSSHRFTPSVMDALETRSQLSGSFAGFPERGLVPRAQSPVTDFVSRREALSMAQTFDQQSAAASRELEAVRGQIAQLHSQAAMGLQATAGRQEALAAQVENRVAQSVAHYEQIGAQTAARADQAQTHSAAAMQTAQHATVVGEHAQSVASQAHSAGSEAIRRTQELANKQSEDVNALREQVAALRTTQNESNALIRQVQNTLNETREQLRNSQQTVTNLQGQIQSEQSRVADLQRQLESERTKTTNLTRDLQQVQVDAAAQNMLNRDTAGTSAAGGTQGMLNPELMVFLEQQRQLLQGYQELARLQSSQQASTSAAAGGSSGPRLQIQMRPKEPPAFSGKKDQDVDIWLHQVDDYFALTKPTDADGVAYLVLMLQGFARDWWEAEVKSSHGRYPGTIEEMKMLLRAAFSSPLRERKARAEIRNLRQGQGEDYREYAARYKSLLARLPPGSYSDAVAMDDWIFGLTPPYGERVMALKPKTLNEAIATMGELDIAHQFCRRDGGRSQGKTSSGGADQKTSKKGKKQQKGSSGTQYAASGSGQGSGSAQPSGNQGNKKQSQGKNKGTSDKDIECFYCKKKGHKKSECRKFARDVQAKFAVLKAATSTSKSDAPSGPGQQSGRKDGPQQGN